MNRNKYTYFSHFSWREMLSLVLTCLKVWGVLFLLFIIIHFVDLLQLIGKNLAASDSPQPVETVFVLGGNSYERGIAAANYLKDYPTQVVCTGGNFPVQIQALGHHLSEAELTKQCLLRQGIDSTKIQILESATSSFEESEEILKFAKQHNLKKIAVLSSEYHLRRLRMTFEDKFKKEGIELIFLAAKNENFTPETWYKNEEGLITTFNEYAKMVYYLFKYS
jgi:uncharacterized SAM-binding protein YcdF (DUF218 family)